MTATLDSEILDVRTPAEVVMLDLQDILPDPAQARDEGADDELAALILANGFYDSKPIEVRPLHAPPGHYMIVDGERRYRGAMKAGLTHVPAMIIHADDEGERLLRQVNSNQGKPLKPLEEARTYKRIMDAKGWTIAFLAEHLGKSKSTVSDRVAMAEAPAAFVPLFEAGTLTAAAAPIVRQYADIPNDRLVKIVEGAQRQSWDWRDAVAEGKPVPLEVVKAALEEEVIDTLPTLFPDDAAAKEYAGPTVKIGGNKYAIDAQKFDAIEARIRAEEQAKAKLAPKPKADPAQDKWKLEEKKRREATQRKRDLRALQFTAISAKLPAALDAVSLLFVIRSFAADLGNGHGLSLCKALGLDYGRSDVTKAIVKHAEGLDLKGRVRLLLQMTMAGELNVSEWDTRDAKRIPEAARLAKVDLKKVKLAAEPKATTSAKKRS